MSDSVKKDGVGLDADPSEDLTTNPHESIWLHLSTVAFRQGWVDVRGVRTRYAQAGSPDAPAVIMIHGTGGNWETFCANLGPHSEHFNCFAIDSLGSGYTDKPPGDYQIEDYIDHIRGFMEEVRVRQASFIGVSLGAWVAARLSLTNPELVRSITLNAAFGMTNDQEEIGGIIARRGKAYDEPTWGNIKQIFDSLIYDKQKRMDDFIALRRQIYGTAEVRPAASQILSLFGPNLAKNLIPEEDWRQIEVPALVIGSLNDRPIFLQTARRAAELMRRAQLVEMDGVGHWPHYEKPEEFNRTSIEFLLEQWG